TPVSEIQQDLRISSDGAEEPQLAFRARFGDGNGRASVTPHSLLTLAAWSSNRRVRGAAIAHAISGGDVSRDESRRPTRGYLQLDCRAPANGQLDFTQGGPRSFDSAMRLRAGVSNRFGRRGQQTDKGKSGVALG